MLLEVARLEVGLMASVETDFSEDLRRPATASAAILAAKVGTPVAAVLGVKGSGRHVAAKTAEACKCHNQL